MIDRIRRLELWPAFKNIAIIFSFSLNMIMLVLVIIAAFWIIPSTNQLAKPIITKLSKSVEDMVSAEINQTIQVNDQIPITFDLPVSAFTSVELTAAVPMAVTTSFVLPNGGGNINGTVYFELPQGTLLPVALNIMVPVSQTVPIDLAIDVNIPLDETEMGPPLMGLKEVIAPIEEFLSDFPSDNRDFFRRMTTGAENSQTAVPAEATSGN
jgi:hypothetical protein